MLVIVKVILAAFEGRALRRGNVVGLTRGGLFTDALPDLVDHLLIVEALVDAITPKQEEVEVVSQLKHADLRLAHNNVRVATVFGSFGLDVAEGARNGQTAGEYAQGSLNIKVFFVGACGSLRKSLSAVYLTSGGLDPLPLQLAVGLVVPAHDGGLAARVQTHDTPAVPHVNDVGGVINYYNADRAASRTLGSHDLARILFLSPGLGDLHQLDIALLTFFKAGRDRSFRFLREFIVLHDEVVQVIS